MGLYKTVIQKQPDGTTREFLVLNKEHFMKLLKKHLPSSESIEYHQEQIQYHQEQIIKKQGIIEKYIATRKNVTN